LASDVPAPSLEKGANVVINGLGDADEIEKTRAAIEADFGVKLCLLAGQHAERR
jgi:hypothetical protein